MKDILAEPNGGVLAQLAGSNALVAFDYDGTLAPIVDDPDEARMRDTTRELLERVARSYPCIVISGRSQQDALRRIRGTGVFEVIGNHGLEPWRRTEAFSDRVASWIPTLTERLGDHAGVTIEDKVFSIALHYRHAPSRKEARTEILRVCESLPGVRVVGGNCVVNLIPEGAPHKGTALAMAKTQLRCDMALYVGDDETDEDVFGLDDAAGLLTVRVGAEPSSRAGFYLRDQAQVDVLLGRLLELRSHDRTRNGR
jgi:trehalose 6-phosphate phosphatase